MRQYPHPGVGAEKQALAKIAWRMTYKKPSALASSRPRVVLSRVRKLPYLDASCRLHAVPHAWFTESQEWVTPLMKQSLLNAGTLAGRCHARIRSPVRRP